MSSTSETSRGSRRAKQTLNLQRTLLKDIQSAGGVGKFHGGSSQALAFLCDTRPELSGGRGDKVRERIGKKVQHWKQLEKDQWFGLLQSNNVTELPSKNQVSKRQWYEADPQEEDEIATKEDYKKEDYEKENTDAQRLV